MIEHIRTIGFKGFDLDEAVPNKVIYSGRNKSGKSTRAGAIAIALYGHIPFSTAGKKPGDILDSFGSQSLIVAVKIKGTEFARKFSRNSKGVSQVMQVNKGKVDAKGFAVAFDRVGAPKIANTAEFMKQSEAKKIDTLFDLFPNPELASIDIEIEDAKADVSRLEDKIKGAKSTVVRLTNSKQSYQIPSGSIAETKAQIKTVETQISDLETQIKEAEIEEAEKVKTKAVEDAKAEAKTEIAKEGGMSKKDAMDMINGMSPEKSHEQFQDSHSDHAYIDNSYPEVEARFGSISSEEKQIDPTDALISKGEKQIADYKENGGFGVNQVMSGTFVGRNEGDSIQRIIEALNDVGCGTCAALIVAKQELKKFKGAS